MSGFIQVEWSFSQAHTSSFISCNNNKNETKCTYNLKLISSKENSGNNIQIFVLC